jgi:hypothetical protein
MVSGAKNSRIPGADPTLSETRSQVNRRRAARVLAKQAYTASTHGGIPMHLAPGRGARA